LQVGTGGLATGEYYRAKGDKGYAFARYDSPEKQNVTERTPTEDIARVREVLKLTVTELATVVGVSRQAVYDWLSGKPVAADNADKLSSLGRAADAVAAEVPNPVFALRRKLAGGKTFIEFVKDGGDAEHAALTLVSMLRRESEQRDRLQARLAARKDRKVGSAVMGVPMHNEES
jgi:transcriptional regulator with XRE-family HTH domain